VPEARAQHYLRIIVEYVFGAIAVMHVKIHDGNALQMVMCQSVCSTYSYIIENAES